MTRGIRILLLAVLAALCSDRAMATTTCTFTTTGTTMRLDADCSTDATIFVPNGLTLDGAGHTIAAVDPPADHFRGAVIRNAGAVASVTGLTITASGLQDACDFGAGIFGEDRLRGIALYNASGLIVNNRVLGLHQPDGSVCNEGTAILAESGPFDGTHPHTQVVIADHNQVSDVQQIGIAAQGDVFFVVTNNTVQLWPAIGPGIAQNGIILAAGASGIVQRNGVQSAYHDGVAFFTNGIQLFESGPTYVASNIVTSVQEGIFVQSQCLRAQNENGNVIVGNAMVGVSEGVVVVARTVAGSICDARANQNTVSLNVIAASPQITPLTGVFYGRQFIAGTFTPVADSNSITFNLITGGFQFPLFDADSSNSTVNGNIIQ